MRKISLLTAILLFCSTNLYAIIAGDPGTIDVYQDGELVGHAYIEIAKRTRDAQVAHWVFFDNYKFPVDETSLEIVWKPPSENLNSAGKFCAFLGDKNIKIYEISVIRFLHFAERNITSSRAKLRRRQLRTLKSNRPLPCAPVTRRR